MRLGLGLSLFFSLFLSPNLLSLPAGRQVSLKWILGTDDAGAFSAQTHSLVTASYPHGNNVKVWQRAFFGAAVRMGNIHPHLQTFLTAITKIHIILTSVNFNCYNITDKRKSYQGLDGIFNLNLHRPFRADFFN